MNIMFPQGTDRGSVGHDAGGNWKNNDEGVGCSSLVIIPAAGVLESGVALLGVVHKQGT